MCPAAASHNRVRKIVGDAGITVLQQDNPHSRAWCMGVWVNTGSRDEQKGEEGLSHFVEHMIFKGTASRSALEISQDIEKIGGSLDAFTTKEQLCVYVQVLDDHKSTAIDVLGDMIVHPTFPADQIPLEQQVVLEEISDVMDAPDDLIHDLFAGEVFAGHPLGKPILGNPESVASFTRRKLQGFTRRHFRSDNMVVAIYGKADARLLKTIGRRLSRSAKGRVRRAARRAGKYQPMRRLFKRKLHHQHICIGVQCCAYTDEQRYPLMVLTTLLGGGMSSRLFQRIREELGLAYNVFTYADSARDVGLMGTYMSVKPAKAGVAVREVFKEFKRITSGSIGAAEFEDTKEHLKGRILLGLETSAAKMMRLARNELYFGRQISERELIRAIDRVTMDDVMDVARDVLDVDRNTIVSLGPSGQGLFGVA